MHMRFRPGFAPDPAGELTVLPRRAAYSWVKEGRGERRDAKGKGQQKGAEEQERGKGRESR